MLVAWRAPSYHSKDRYLPTTRPREGVAFCLGQIYYRGITYSVTLMQRHRSWYDKGRQLAAFPVDWLSKQLLPTTDE